MFLSKINLQEKMHECKEVKQMESEKEKEKFTQLLQ